MGDAEHGGGVSWCAVVIGAGPRFLPKEPKVANLIVRLMLVYLVCGLQPVGASCNFGMADGQRHAPLSPEALALSAYARHGRSESQESRHRLTLGGLGRDPESCRGLVQLALADEREKPVARRIHLAARVGTKRAGGGAICLHYRADHFNSLAWTCLASLRWRLSTPKR